MIADVRACVPENLSAFGRRIALAEDHAAARGAQRLRNVADLEAVLAAFGEPFGPHADRRAVVSLWTQYWFAALVVASVTATLCLDRELPLALADTSVEFDERCRPACLLVGRADDRRAGAGCNRFSCLIDSHLRPLIDLCALLTGIPPRVLWGNAAVIFDATLRELARTREIVPAASAEAEALLGRCGTPCATSPLRHALVASPPDGAVRRRVCCLRFRLPGVPDCGALCPMIARRGTSAC